MFVPKIVSADSIALTIGSVQATVFPYDCVLDQPVEGASLMISNGVTISSIISVIVRIKCQIPKLLSICALLISKHPIDRREILRRSSPSLVLPKDDVA